jgi:hypothetical protein
MASLRREGANPNAVVDKDGYGGHKWSVWSHRMAGDTVLHLALRWRKTSALAGLYPLAMRATAGPAKPWLDEPDPVVFDLKVTDQAGCTASEVCEAEHGVPLAQFWRDARAADLQRATDAAQRMRELIEEERQTRYLKLRAAAARAAEEYRLEVRAIGTDAEADSLLEQRRVIVPLKHPARQSGAFGQDIDLESRTESKRNVCNQVIESVGRSVTMLLSERWTPHLLTPLQRTNAFYEIDSCGLRRA